MNGYFFLKLCHNKLFHMSVLGLKQEHEWDRIFKPDINIHGIAVQYNTL